MQTDTDGLDADALAFVEAMRATRAPPIDTVPLPALRAMYRDKAAMVGGPAPAMVSRTIDAGPVPMRLLSASPPDGTRPALIALHGGGYVLGDLDSHDHLWRQIAAASGWAVLAIDYRRAPEHRFPAAAEDAIAATAWAISHAAQLGVDPARLVVGGDSAGGNLAAVAALALRGTAPALAGQVLIYPATDAASANETYPSRRENAKLPPLDRSVSRFFLESYLPDPAARSQWRASPQLAPSHAGLPPTLLITAGHDPLHDEAAAYGAALRQAGVAVTHRDFAGQVHGFIEMAGIMAAAREAIAVIAAWLGQRSTPSGGDQTCFRRFPAPDSP